MPTCSPQHHPIVKRENAPLLAALIVFLPVGRWTVRRGKSGFRRIGFQLDRFLISVATKLLQGVSCRRLAVANNPTRGSAIDRIGNQLQRTFKLRPHLTKIFISIQLRRATHHNLSYKERNETA